jgi:chromosomal replication initiator protein
VAHTELTSGFTDEPARIVTRFALQQRVPATLNPRYTFPQFIVGRSNEAAYAAASAAAVAPGRLYNPILLTGATGLGKTHLAHAVTAEATLRDPLRTTELLTADDFLRRLSAAVSAGTPELLLDQLARAALIVVDDVHVLDRHATAQEALLALASRAIATGRQLVITSDDAAGASALAQRIVRRFRTGHSASIGVPDWAHRVAILHAKAATLGVELPPSVAHHLASQCEGSVRELEGSLTRLLAVASLDGSPLTLVLARRAVATRANRSDANGTMHPLRAAQAVQDAVAAEWGVSPDELIGAGRSRRVVEPRRIGMLLCQELLNLSLREIGGAFGDRDSSTVLSALARARSDLADSPEVAERVARLRQMLPSANASSGATDAAVSSTLSGGASTSVVSAS